MSGQMLYQLSYEAQYTPLRFTQRKIWVTMFNIASLNSTLDGCGVGMGVVLVRGDGLFKQLPERNVFKGNCIITCL